MFACCVEVSKNFLSKEGKTRTSFHVVFKVEYVRLGPSRTRARLTGWQFQYWVAPAVLGSISQYLAGAFAYPTHIRMAHLLLRTLKVTSRLATLPTIFNKINRVIYPKTLRAAFWRDHAIHRSSTRAKIFVKLISSAS